MFAAHLRGASRRIAALALAGAAVALVACTPEVNVSSSGAEVSGIAVSGSGTTSVRPDLALVNLGIEVTSPTVAEARSKAATTMEALTTAVKGKGVAEADIQTQFFNIYPQYGAPNPTDLKPTTPQIVGYTVSNQVQLKIRNLDSVSTVLDSAIAAGGDSIRVNGMQFTVEKPDQFKAKAREEAVQNARERAEVLAKAAGVKVGPARSITESGGGFPQFDARSAQAPGGLGGPTPVSPGQETLEVVVNVVFEIER